MSDQMQLVKGKPHTGVGKSIVNAEDTCNICLLYILMSLIPYNAILINTYMWKTHDRTICEILKNEKGHKSVIFVLQQFLVYLSLTDLV